MTASKAILVPIRGCLGGMNSACILVIPWVMQPRSFCRLRPAPGLATTWIEATSAMRGPERFGPRLIKWILWRMIWQISSGCRTISSAQTIVSDSRHLVGTLLPAGEPRDGRGRGVQMTTTDSNCSPAGLMKSTWRALHATGRRIVSARSMRSNASLPKATSVLLWRPSSSSSQPGTESCRMHRRERVGGCEGMSTRSFGEVSMQQQRRLKKLSDYTLHADDGDIGHLRQVFFDDRDWRVRYLVVHTGSWLLGRDVLLIPETVTKIDDDKRRIDVELTQQQIEEAPPTSSQLTVSRHYEQELYRHYDWRPYWDEDLLLGLRGTVDPLADSVQGQEPVNPYLRSSNEVVGYTLNGADGDLGEVSDFVIEAPGWRIRYLDIATGGWLFGRHILMACAWLEDIKWSDLKVTTVLAREAIESAPSYDTGEIISREYELALYKHYGKHFEDEAG